ncbi:hypothetical protein OROHE_002311 [Orobanche hederae]
MATKDKTMATDPSTPTGAEAEAEADTYCNVDDYSYLGINDNGEYFVSEERVKIPQGITFKKIEEELELIGLRQYVFYKDGSGTYDIVIFGTLDVQNGVAYVSGDVIAGEEPALYIPRVIYPPIVIVLAVQVLPFKIEDCNIGYTKLKKNVARKMLRIDTADFDPDECDVIDFDLERPRNIFPPHPVCGECGNKMRVYRYRACPQCDMGIYQSCGDDEVETGSNVPTEELGISV